MCLRSRRGERGSFGDVSVEFFAIFSHHLPSLRFVNMAAMAEGVSASTKRKFSASDTTKTAETFGNVSLTQAQQGDVNLFIQPSKYPV